jgi:hypothetical protein
VKSELDAFLAASDADLAPLLQEALQSAVSAYEELKARAGRLDFLELLVKARTPILDVPAQSLRAREAEWEFGTFATDKYRSSLTTSRNYYAA